MAAEAPTDVIDIIVVDNISNNQNIMKVNINDTIAVFCQEIKQKSRHQQPTHVEYDGKNLSKVDQSQPLWSLGIGPSQQVYIIADDAVKGG